MSAYLRRAIEDYTAALAVYGEENSPKEWAATQNNLGSAYAELPTGDRAQNLKKAIEGSSQNPFQIVR